jgi:uncharacterized protein involved in exopolysaccharide biosynthesis
MSEEPQTSTKYVMVESNPSFEDDEIDLLELIRTLLQAWKAIVGITMVCIGIAVVYALNAPDVFKVETLLAPARKEKSGASSAISQFGGLATMAGITIPSDSNIEQVLATLESRKFLKVFIDKNKLLPILFEGAWDPKNQSWIVESEEKKPTDLKAIEFFKAILSVDEDKKSGLITLSISWKDPTVAAKWANDLVKQLNELLRQKAIADSRKRVGYLEQELAKTTLQDMRTVLYNILESEKQKAMLANVNEDFALEVIDPAVAPEGRAKPNRKLIVALGGVCGFFLSIFAVFLRNFLRKLRYLNSIKNKNYE